MWSPDLPSEISGWPWVEWLLTSEGLLCVRCSMLDVRERCLSGTSSYNPSVSWIGWLGGEEARVVVVE